MGSEFSVTNKTGNPCVMNISRDGWNPLPPGSTTKSGHGTLSMNYGVYMKEQLEDGSVKIMYRLCWNAPGANGCHRYNYPDDFCQENIKNCPPWGRTAKWLIRIDDQM